jgi:hypothetical protein
MKITELVRRLEEIQKQRGDLDVVIYDEDQAEDFSTYTVDPGYDGSTAIVVIAAERG